jgi:hypothetical protein
MFVKDHPDAIKVTGLPGLWTLITSNRQIPVLDSSGSIQIFSDWEELPDTPEGARIWDMIAETILNPAALPLTEKTAPKSAPCFDRATLVFKYQSGLTPISEITRGDWIMGGSRDSWTQVIGICERQVQTCIGKKGSFMTDGVCILNPKTAIWEHPIEKGESRQWQGFNLITDSGAFTIQLDTGRLAAVRDFTEVGWMNLEATYARVENAMPLAE